MISWMVVGGAPWTLSPARNHNWWKLNIVRKHLKSLKIVLRAYISRRNIQESLEVLLRPGRVCDIWAAIHSSPPTLPAHSDARPLQANAAGSTKLHLYPVPGWGAWGVSLRGHQHFLSCLPLLFLCFRGPVPGRNDWGLWGTLPFLYPASTCRAERSTPGMAYPNHLTWAWS